ncbi:elongation factor G, partial [Thermanaerothrix sp.]|uniref:elongation factor G n=1 Tax=Thermanaerothrix sp. TaxID=2972675 RepID=UPI002ADE26B7
LTMQAIYWEDELGREPVYMPIPDDLRAQAEEWRAIMVERIAEFEDDLIVKYLEGEELTVDELKRALRKAVIANKATPIFCGSALRNRGIQPLLDAVIDYLPSPADIPPVKGTDPDNPDVIVERRPSDDEPMCALVFKIVADPYVGRLAYFRVYSGKVTQGDMVLNSSRRRKERIGRIVRMYADRREDVSEICAGDIGAVLGLKDTFTGDTLCDPKHPIVLESITFPEPVISVAVEPKTTADQDRMAEALRRLAEEDPTFKVRFDENTGQTIISGMGELHLDIIVDRMMREFRVQANVGRPRVSYRETISRPVPEVNYRYVKQTGGRGQYGHVIISLEPLERGNGIKFIDKTVGGVIPKEYIPAIEKGILEAAEAGVLAGYPVTDVQVTLLGGSYHEVDSSDMAFKVAASFAFKEGVQRGAPVLLEPIMKVEVLVPEANLGDVLGQLNARRAEIQGMEPRPGGMQAVRALVPLAEMFGYATELRSATQGRGIYTMEFDHYAPVPESVRVKILG